MIPEIDIFGITLSWYWLPNIVGISLGIWLLYPKMKQYFGQKDIAIQVIGLLIMGGYIFAKVFSTIEFYIINNEPINIEIVSFFVKKVV